jgi:hypothetical protein
MKKMAEKKEVIIRNVKTGEISKISLDEFKEKYTKKEKLDEMLRYLDTWVPEKDTEKLRYLDTWVPEKDTEKLRYLDTWDPEKEKLRYLDTWVPEKEDK